MSDDTSEAALRETLSRLESAGETLRRRDPESIADALLRAWELIADPERALGRAARDELPKSTGLSLPMVAWALAATFSRAGASEMADAVRSMAPPPGMIAAPVRSSVLILAGNVFTACVAPWSFALLARSPLLVKASSRDDVLPRLFHVALAETDPVLADACAVFSFPSGSPPLEATLLSRADVVSAYGSDATLSAIRSRLSANTIFVPHGNGLGVGYVTRAMLDDDESARAAADAFALDVAAYDQRGCLSPHAIWVEQGGRLDARQWAGLLSNALAHQNEQLPRGVLPMAAGAAQIQWRGVALARGVLFEGDGWAVSYEGPAALRISPGWRNVMVLDSAGIDSFSRGLAPLGVHLKCVGVAGDEDARLAVAGALVPPLAARVSEAGQLQRPSLLALADGRLPWEGLVRYTEVR